MGLVVVRLLLVKVVLLLLLLLLWRTVVAKEPVTSSALWQRSPLQDLRSIKLCALLSTALY